MSANTAQQAPGNRRAAFTIASSDCLAGAKVLAKSYLRHHPEHRFLVIMLEGSTIDHETDNEPFELVPLENIPLPNPGVFVYQYSRDELKAAVKPFCLKHLFHTYELDGVLYIDPDILVLRPLQEAWEGLEECDVVLVPRMREPFTDAATPSELMVLQGGVYHAGFLGLRDGDDANKFLDWWMERLYADCTVDLPQGLSLDGKWLDSVPAYFERVEILREPTYNVGHMNLHERSVTQGEDVFLVDGQALATFQFSGYDPSRPELLSRYQSRHSLAELPAIRILCNLYAGKLQAAGGVAARRTERPYSRLRNGVEVARAINRAVLQCVRNRVMFPSPADEPDAFCRFLTTPNPRIFGANVAPIVTALLRLRPDVAVAHPGAWTDKRDAGFHAWLQATGAAEEQLQSLLDLYAENLAKDSAMACVLAIYDRRPDLRDAFPGAFSDSDGYRGFGAWLASFGPVEEGVDDAMLSSFQQVEAGFYKTIHAYFGSLELMAKHQILFQDRAIAALICSFSRSLIQFPQLAWSHVLVFERVAKSRRNDLLLASLRYNPYVRAQIGGVPSAFNLDRIREYLANHGADSALGEVVQALLKGNWISPMAQFRAFWAGNRDLRDLFPDAGTSPAQTLQCAYHVLDRPGLWTSRSGWDVWARRLIAACHQPLQPGVNLVGYMGAATGIGESARSISRQLAAIGIACSKTVLASGFQEPLESIDADLKTLYGAPDPTFDLNIIVANAHDFPRVREWLPQDIWPGRLNLGYWVWETEALPGRFGETARGLDAILTPSEYSASAIRRAVDIPVHVVPHSPDFAALGEARSDRAAFGLAPDVLVYGYFFDCKSELERKNPAGLIDAFRLAFKDREDVALILKVNSPAPGAYHYEQLKVRASGLNVVWLEEPLDRQKTCNLMASLDVYVSLHRAEGFGLTMAEAMVIGKPVIATGYSGNMEFMDSGCALLVDHEVITTRRAYGPYPAGSRWSEPCTRHAAELMHLLTSKKRREQLGGQARSHVDGMLGTAVVARRLGRAMATVRQNTGTAS